MKQVLLPLMRIGIFSFACLNFSSEIANAQVTADDSVNTQVTKTGDVSEITGGETRGDNLFHSFQEFSVETGKTAAFLNSNDIANIFSRVTGGNISNIDGLIKANGSANLFLINPAGIIFGEGASLNIGGSFYGSSASSILFKDGEYSATDLENPPVLTINAPIGLGFRDNPGDIVNRSIVQNDLEEKVGLSVLPGNSLSLIGGDINFEDGKATAKGGSITLGGLSQAGRVNLNEDGNFTFPENIAKSEINFSGVANGNVVGSGGRITLNAQNLNFLAKQARNNFLTAGIEADSNSPQAQAGDITINVTENTILNNSLVVNEVVEGGVGSAGNINITTGNLSLVNGSVLFASTAGKGNGGSIALTADNNITVDGGNDQGDISSLISGVSEQAEGNAGSISIVTGNLNFTGGGSIFANAQGKGNAGNVNITARDTITFDGESSGGLPGGIVSVVLPGAEGKGGNLNITTSNLNFTNGARIDSSTEGIGNAGSINISAEDTITFDGETSGGVVSSAFALARISAEGDGGDVKITTDNLKFTNGGRVFASTEGKGNAGNVDIIARDTITFDGTSIKYSLPSGIVSLVDDNAEGNAGEINLRANNINFTNGGGVDASTEGLGNAGLIKIAATDNITFDGANSNGFTSSALSQVRSQGKGEAGGVSIVTDQLNLTNGARVDASTQGIGDAGSIDIEATSIALAGSTTEIRSGISANALDNDGKGGDINIVTDQLRIANGGTIEATNFDSLGVFDPGTGQPGNITIQANNIDLIDRGRIEAATQSTTGESGIIDLQVAEDITLENNSFISARAFDEANGGNLDIDARFIVAFPNQNNDIIANAQQGNGGRINITAESVLGIEKSDLNDFTNDINASSETNLDGTVSITILEPDSIRGVTELPSNLVEVRQINEQTCSVDRDTGEANGLTVKGRGGVQPSPDLPLSSQTIMNNGKNAATEINEAQVKAIASVHTSQGDIIPAQGVVVTKDGRITLTAYPTSSNTRVPQGSVNCDKLGGSSF